MRATWMMMAALLALAGCKQVREAAPAPSADMTPAPRADMTPAPRADMTPAPRADMTRAPRADMTPDAAAMPTHPTKPPSAPPPIGIIPHGTTKKK